MREVETLDRKRVKVESINGRLRIRFTVARKTYTIGLRLNDTELNRRIADSKATAIELDILSDNFDESLAKYKPKSLKSDEKGKRKKLTFQELWSEYTEERSKDLATRTINDKFASLAKRINDFGKDIKTQEDAERFKAYLEQFNKPRQVLDKLTDCNACYKWGMEQGFVEMNWFDRVKRQVNVEPTREIKPFTGDEIRRILDGFQYPKYVHYHEYVQFLFLTGCRTSEAIGLKWKHIKEDFSEIWIGESLTRGVKKSTKTNKARVFPCNQQLKRLLERRYVEQIALTNLGIQDNYVFTSPDGKTIDDKNFSARYWKPVLLDMEIEYRSQYTTRHSFISHMLASGMEPVKIASIVGHDVKVLYQRYAGVISRIEVPELNY